MVQYIEYMDLKNADSRQL